MKAMIFAAGLGTRLHPLTTRTPKALVCPHDKPMLQLVAQKLIRAGVNQLVINIHHHPELMKNFIQSMRFQGVEITISDESDQLLDTGGGLMKASEWLRGNDPIILHNVDVLSDVDLQAMLKFHMQHNPLVTLAVSARPANRSFLWQQGRLVGWENKNLQEKVFFGREESYIIRPMAFSGIHIVQPDLFSLISEKGVFSITPVYLRLAQKHKIIPFEHPYNHWVDMGSFEKLKTASDLLQKNPTAFL